MTTQRKQELISQEELIGVDIPSAVAQYLEKSPLATFREPELDANPAWDPSRKHHPDYFEYCKGTYYPNSSHSNFGNLLRTHRFNLALPERRGETPLHDNVCYLLKTPNSRKDEGDYVKFFELSPLSDYLKSLFYARFLVGYGANEVIDSINGRTGLFHQNSSPGDVANILSYPYNTGRDVVDYVTGHSSPELKKVIKELSDTLVANPTREQLNEIAKGLVSKFENLSKMMQFEGKK